MMTAWMIAAVVMATLNLVALGLQTGPGLKLANAFVAVVLILQLLAFFGGKAL